LAKTLASSGAAKPGKEEPNKKNPRKPLARSFSDFTKLGHFRAKAGIEDG
jgi:hypothetical protein